MKEHVIIGKDRSVSVPNSLKKIGIQYDHNVNTITFDCPRYPDEDSSIDMARMQIFLNYMLPDKTMDCSIMENVVVDETDPTIMHFDWVVKRNHTRVNGVLSTLICIKDTDTEGNEIYHWNTDLFQSFSVGNGMECSEQIVDMNPDVITQLLVRMGEVDNRTSTEAMQGYVNTYMEKNPVEASQEQVNQSVNTYFAENPPSPSDQQVSNSVNTYMNQNPPQPTDEQASAGISAYMNQNPPTPTDEQASTAINAYMTEHAQSCIDDYLTEHPVTPTEEQMKNGVAANSELLQSSVDDYLGRNPLQLDEGLTESTKAAPADKVGEIQSDIDVLKGNLVETDSRLSESIANISESIYKISERAFTETEHLFYDASSFADATAQANTFRAFLNGHIPKGSILKTIDIFHKARKQGSVITVELWSMDNNILSKVQGFDLSVSSNIAEFETYNIPHVAETDIYVSFKTADTGVMTMVSDGSTARYKKDLTSTTIDYNSMATWGFTSKVKLMYYEVNDYIQDALKFKGNIITVGKDCDYTDIQEAIDNANDSENNHVTIYVRKGVYEKFSMCNWAFFNSGATKRYISIIGEGKDLVKVISDKGDYRLPACECWTDGTIKGITFESNHDNPYEHAENQKRKAYGLHLDFGECDTVFEDCRFISYQAPAIGIGLRQDMTVSFYNCEFFANGEPYNEAETDLSKNFTLMTNYGAFYLHSANYDNTTGQKLIMRNCVAISKNGNRGSWIQALKTGTELILDLTNNVSVTQATGDGMAYSGADMITVLKQSYGNNFNLPN